MRIQQVSLTPTHEQQVQWEVSSQEARIEGFTNSEAPCNLYAARLERAIRISQPAPAPIQQQNQEAAQQDPAVKKWKAFCHSASLVCAALILPSLACLVFGAIGLVVPAALFAASVVLNVLGGKLTAEIQAVRDERAARNAVYDPR